MREPLFGSLQLYCLGLLSLKIAILIVTFIENDVKIGHLVKVKSGLFIWDGIEIADDEFLGRIVTFINDKYPRSKQYPKKFQDTRTDNFVSIGANSTIMGGIQIGEYALIAAGSLVTEDVLAFSLMLGSPARMTGKVDKNCVIERIQYFN